MATWSDLPNEIRLAILEKLLDDTKNPANHIAVGRPLKRRHCRLYPYALVCKQWNAIVEAEMYRHIFVTQDSVRNLLKLGPRRQKLVRYIWLKVELAQYGCTQYLDGATHWATARRNALTVLVVVRMLFDILNGWLEDRSEGAKGLTLEISAFSLSDADHCFFNDLHFDTSPFHTHPLETYRPAITNVTHGWISGRRTRAPHLSSFSIFKGSITPQQFFPYTLPTAPAVTSFVLRRQTRAHLIPCVLRSMLRSLPSLRRVHIEPWRGYPSPHEQSYHPDIYLLDLIALALPPKVRELTIFEDFNEDFDTVVFHDPLNVLWLHPPELTRTPAARIGESLAQRSQPLTRLAASYMVDAYDFFDAAIKFSYTWDNLTSLFLTSPLVTDETNYRWINELLENAGIAAMNMPALRVMHIWNGAKGKLCGFRYQVTDSETAIQWRGHWDMYLSLEVIGAWKEVAATHTRNDLTVKESELIVGRYIGSHAVAMEELGVHKDVVHPVSFQQIKCETSRYWYTNF